MRETRMSHCRCSLGWRFQASGRVVWRGSRAGCGPQAPPPRPPGRRQRELRPGLRVGGVEPRGPTHPNACSGYGGWEGCGCGGEGATAACGACGSGFAKGSLDGACGFPGSGVPGCFKVADQRVGPARARAAQAQRRGPTGAESGKAWPGTKAKATAKALAKAKAQAAMPGSTFRLLE